MTEEAARTRPYWREPGYALLLLFAGLETLVAAPLRFAPAALAAHGISGAEIGSIMGAGGVGSALALVPSTYLARSHPRLAMVSGALMQGCALLLPLLGLAKWPMVALYFFASTGQSVVYASAFTAVAEATPARHATQGAALYWAVAQLSRNIVGPSIVEVLLAHDSFARTAAWFGALGILGAVARATMPLPAKASGGGVTGRADPRRVARFALVFLCAGILFVAQDGFLTAFAMSRALHPVTPFLLAYSIVMVGGRLLFGGVPDRWGKRRTAIASLLVWALFFSCMSVVHRPISFWALGALAGAANTLLWPTLYALSYEVIPTKAYATATTTLLLSLAFLLGAPAIGHLVDLVGYAGMLTAAATAAVATAGCFYWMR